MWKNSQKFKNLHKDVRLKGLSNTQLCDLVWQWIPFLETKVLKKDSLSSLVAKHSTVRNTYFKLDTDATGIIEAINQYLLSKGEVLTKADEAYLKKIRTEYIDQKLDEEAPLNLNIGLIQGTELIPFLKGMLASRTVLLNRILVIGQ